MTRETRLRRVVVTGCGVITPLGCTVPDFWAALLAGRSGVRTITRFDASALRTRIAAEVSGFNPADHLTRRVYHRIDPFAQYALVAATQAAEEAKPGVDAE